MNITLESLMSVAVEGPDGVGKTKVTEHLVENCGYTLIEKPTSIFCTNKDQTIDYKRFEEVLNQLYQCSEEIRTAFIAWGNLLGIFMNDNSDVKMVFDRHLLSNYFLNGGEKLDVFYEKLVQVCGVPDMTILLDASPEERKKRIIKRNPNDPDLFDCEIFQNNTSEMIEILEHFNMPYVYVNTENKSIEEVCEKVTDIVQQAEREKKNKNKVLGKEKKL